MKEINNKPIGAYAFTLIVLSIYLFIILIMNYQGIINLFFNRENLSSIERLSLKSMGSNMNTAVLLSYLFLGYLLSNERYKKSKIVYLIIKSINSFRSFLGLKNLIK